MSEKTMRLYTANYQGLPTFGAFPVAKDSALLNLLYDPKTKQLAVIGSSIKKGFVLEDALDSNGHPEEISGKRGNELLKRHPNIYPFKKVRVETDVTNEYLVTEREEQIEVIERFCENTKTFDFMKYINAEPVVEQQQPQPTPEQQLAQLNELVAGAKEHGAELKIVQE